MKNTGESNPNWNGGRFISSHGYVMVKTYPGRLGALAYEYEHRLVAEKKIGRKLKKGEQVHHINGNKKDNSPENIRVFKSMAHHKVEHRNNKIRLRLPGEDNPTVECLCGCGTQFKKYDSSGRQRRFVLYHAKGLSYLNTFSKRRINLMNNTEILCSCGCGASFKKHDKWGRPRKYISGHNSKPHPKLGDNEKKGG